MKMGKYDEAIQWCERILKDRAGKVDIARAINKKKAEINSEKDLTDKTR